MLPVWFCACRLSGQVAVWKGRAVKTMHARKKLPACEMFGWLSSFWWTKPKMFPPCLDGCIGWKLGWIYCFFTSKVQCTYSKQCTIFKLTEYVARPIFKHPVKFQVIRFRGKKVITVYLTPQPRRDFVLFDWVRSCMCSPRLYIPPNNRCA